jgi:hypothetical protein
MRSCGRSKIRSRARPTSISRNVRFNRAKRRSSRSSTRLGSEQRPRSSARPRAERAALASQRRADAADLDLQSERSRRRVARAALVVALYGRRLIVACDQQDRARNRTGPGRLVRSGNGVVTPSIQVNVNPKRLSASGFTLTDIVSTITNNNVRAPGGILYSKKSRDELDVRGDIQDARPSPNLLVSASIAARRRVDDDPWSTQTRLFPHRRRRGRHRYLRNAARLRVLERRAVRRRSIFRSRPARAKSRPRSVLAALPELRRPIPNVDFTFSTSSRPTPSSSSRASSAR